MLSRSDPPIAELTAFLGLSGVQPPRRRMRTGRSPFPLLSQKHQNLRAGHIRVLSVPVEPTGADDCLAHPQSGRVLNGDFRDRVVASRFEPQEAGTPIDLELGHGYTVDAHRHLPGTGGQRSAPQSDLHAGVVVLVQLVVDLTELARPHR